MRDVETVSAPSASQLRTFRWHGCDILSELPLALDPSPGDPGALQELHIVGESELELPRTALLAESRFTGYRLYLDPKAGCWLARDEDCIYLSRSQIRVAPEPSNSAQLEYLRTRALALWLHLVEMPPIHASAVARNGNAVALVGDSGAGKSTLAAALVRFGYGLYADDLLPLSVHQGDVWVHPGGPHLRMWPDSAEHFHARSSTLPRVTAGTAKRLLNMGLANSAEVPRLRAIVLLERSSADVAIAIEKLPGSKALLALIAHGQMAGPAELLGLGASRMQVFADVLGCVGVYRIRYPTDYVRLPEVCAALDALVQA